MSWEYSLATHIWIFSVGRGNAAFVRTGLNQGFILDMGCGGDQDFNPADFIKQHLAPKLDKFQGCSIAQAVLSHPHKDHIAQCGELQSGVLHPKLLTCPHDKDSSEKLNWSRIKNPEGSSGLEATYRSLYAKRKLPLQTILFEANKTVPNLEYGIFYLRPPVADKLHVGDNAYGNACSIAFYLRYGSHSVLFPGDMTPEGMRLLLADAVGVEKRYTVFNSQTVWAHPDWHERTSDQPSLGTLLRTYGLSVLVAPHHGLESCYSEDLYKSIRGGKPQITAISERRHKHENDGCLHKMYQSANGTAGLRVDCDGQSEFRNSISTINGHHILISLEGSGLPRVFANRDPKELLKRISALGRGAVA